MFLTQILLDPVGYRSRRLLADTQQMHAAIQASFVDTDGERTLWRIDPMQSDRLIPLLVVSPKRPKMNELTERLADSSAVRTADYQPMLDRLADGGSFGFRITVSPTKAVRKPKSVNGQPMIETNGRQATTTHHVPILQANERHAWLEQRLSGAGLKLDGCIDVGALTDTFRRAPNTQPVVLTKISYVGGAIVSDADALRTALTSGIGRAKGYGCGLLTLARR